MAARKIPRQGELRTDEVMLSVSRMRALSLFGDLPPRMEGRLRGLGGLGAVVVRRYRAGELVCRQHDPGFTAFYLLNTVDLLELRKIHRAMASSADQKLKARAPDKLALTRRERRQAAEALEKNGGDAELASLLFASAGRPEDGEIEALAGELEELEEGDRADAALAASHAALAALDPPAKRRRADDVEAADGELAALLRASARAAELRVRAVVSVARPAGTPPGGLFGRFLRGLGRRDPSADVAGSEDEEEIATLAEGELFGEMSCLYHSPRTATVRAARDLYAVELLGNVLDVLLGSQSFRRDLDAIYRARALGRELRATGPFADAPDDALALLRRRASFVTLKPGEILFEEGAPTSGVYLVRSGTVKLFRRGAEDRPLGHRSRGETFGWSDVARGAPRAATCAGYEHPRASAGRAAGRELPSPRIELVHLDAALLEEVAGCFPGFDQALARAAAEDEPTPETTARGTSRFDDLGLVQGRSLLLVDLERCTRCDDCVRACAEVQADGFPRLGLEGPRFGKYLIASSCRQCADAACLVGCPVRSIHKGAAGQIVIESWCIGCGLCAEQCPYQAIDMRALPGPKGSAPEAKVLEPHGNAGPAMPTERAVTCDQCATIPGGPRCVAACAHDAALRVDARDFFSRAKLR